MFNSTLLYKNKIRISNFGFLNHKQKHFLMCKIISCNALTCIQNSKKNKNENENESLIKIKKTKSK